MSALLMVGMVALLAAGCRGPLEMLGGEAPAATNPGESRSPVKRVVVITMQNRSFNHLFGQFPGVNGIRPDTPGYAQQDANGVTVTPFRLPDNDSGDLPHGRQRYLEVTNNGAMNRFAFHHGARSMGYLDGNTPGVGRLWAWAQEFALADRYFASALDNAPAVALYLVAASNGDIPFSYQPVHGPCNQPDTEARNLTFRHVGDQLSGRGLGWTWFHENYGDCGNYVPQQNPFQYFASTANSNRIQELAEFYRRLDAGTLPAVSFVSPGPANSMHPSSGPVTRGAQWLDSLLTRIRESTSWESTAVVVIWDEAGGWWDHVPPPLVDSQGLGMRVPMMVISPHAKRGYISTQQMDAVSILKFIQWNWDLGPLNSRNEMGNDIRDMFDF
jgi:phospholipase C